MLPKYGSLKFVAVDFDNTITDSAKFPNIGRLRFKAKDLLLDLKKHGIIIIIWTCRTGEHQTDVSNWLTENQIPFDFINENPHCKEAYQKVFADAYVDDRAIAFNGDFDKLETDLIKAGIEWEAHNIVEIPQDDKTSQYGFRRRGEDQHKVIEALVQKITSEAPIEQIVEFVLSNFTYTPKS